jgi:hypothetical protein
VPDFSAPQILCAELRGEFIAGQARTLWKIELTFHSTPDHPWVCITGKVCENCIQSFSNSHKVHPLLITIDQLTAPPAYQQTICQSPSSARQRSTSIRMALVHTMSALAAPY